MIQCKQFPRVNSNVHCGMSDDGIADRINEWAVDHHDIRIVNVTVSLTDEILVFFEENDKVGDLNKELKEVQELLFEIFNQSCQIKYIHETKSFKYSDHGISAYEWVVEYLIKIGRITKEQCE